MSTKLPPSPRERAEALVSRYAAAGYVRLDPPVLQPAEAVLDLTGEHIRKRMFLTSDGEGRDYCLRPDLTIPVCRAYLDSPEAGRSAQFSYLGPVFRYRADAAAEFLQAGVESFGRKDTAAADADVLALALETTAHYGIAKPLIRMGDVGLFSAFIAALDIAPGWKRRLAKDFLRPAALDADLASLSAPAGQGSADYRGLLAALEGADPVAARALIADMLSISGISTVGGRSVAEIAERFLEQAALGAAGAKPDAATIDLVRKFLALEGTPDNVAASLKSFGVDLGSALDGFAARIKEFSARGIDLSAIRFSTAFGRGLDYYSSFVFELHDPSQKVQGQLVAGGRYDTLLAQLKAPSPIAAVGFAAWIERLEQAGRTA